MWDVKSGQPITIYVDDSSVNSLAFSPDGAMLASGNSDESVTLWDVREGKSINSLDDPDAPINSVAFSPDGRFLASGSNDATTKLWDMRNNELMATLGSV